VLNNKDNRVFMSRNYQPIVPRQKHTIIYIETEVKVWENEKCSTSFPVSLILPPGDGCTVAVMSYMADMSSDVM